MDNKAVAQNPQPVQAAVQPVPTQPTVATTVTQAMPDPKPSGNKKVLLILGLIILFLVVLTGVYIYYMQTQPKPDQETSEGTQEDVITGLDSQLNAIELGSEEESFSDVDQDLKSL